MLIRCKRPASERDARYRWRNACLHRTSVLRASIRTHVGQIDRRRDHLDVTHAKLRALCQQLAVHEDHTRAVKVQTATVAAALVRIEIYAARLACRQTHQIDAKVELAQLMMRTGTVAKDLDAIETERNVRTVRSEQLFARLATNNRISELNRTVAKRHTAMLASRANDHLW